MSIIDAIFVAFYFLCGSVVCVVLARHFGLIFAPIGFILGILLPMALWRFVATRLGARYRKKRPPIED